MGDEVEMYEIPYTGKVSAVHEEDGKPTWYEVVVTFQLPENGVRPDRSRPYAEEMRRFTHPDMPV